MCNYAVFFSLRYGSRSDGYFCKAFLQDRRSNTQPVDILCAKNRNQPPPLLSTQYYRALLEIWPRAHCSSETATPHTTDGLELQVTAIPISHWL